MLFYGNYSIQQTLIEPVVNWMRLLVFGHLLLSTVWKIANSPKFVLFIDGHNIFDWNIFIAHILIIFID